MSKVFDAQQYLDAVSPPTFKDPTGRLHVGRVLSVDQWTPLEMRLRAAALTKTWPPLVLAMRLMVRAFFPQPWYKRLRLGVRGRSVETWIFEHLPPIVQLRAVWSFMESQGTALGIKLEAPPGTLIASIDQRLNVVRGDASPTATS